MNGVGVMQDVEGNGSDNLYLTTGRVTGLAALSSTTRRVGVPRLEEFRDKYFLQVYL